MIGISSIGSASGTADYFAKENYYSSEQGHATSEWHGKGAEDLGLNGPVDDKDLLGVLEGKFGDQEKNSKAKHNPGRDLTFSMPKSASIVALVGGDTRVTKAYMTAVKETLDYVESNLIVTRQRGEGNKRETIKTGNAIIALFPHDTSREADPNAHIHAIIANGTKTEDGKYKAINFKELYDVRYELNQIVQERFRHAIHKLGYKTVDKDNGGHWEIVGINQSVRDGLSKRSAQINSALEHINHPTWNQRQVAAYDTRASKTTHDRTELLDKWKAEAKSLGLDAEKFVGATKPQTNKSLWQELRENMSKLFASRHPELPRENVSLARLSDVTKFTIAALSEKRTTFKRTEIIAEVSAITQGGFSISEINNNIEKVQKLDDLQVYQESRFAGEVFTTRTLVRTEENIISAVNEGKGQESLYARSEQGEQMIEASGFSFIPAIDPDLTPEDKIGPKTKHETHNVSPAQYAAIDTGQKVAVETILFGTDKIVGVQGFAGAGKTTMIEKMNEIAKTLNKTQGLSHGFVGLAPTIPATKELQSRIAESGTFQKFQHEMSKIGKDGPNAQMMDTYRGKTVLVDESSMISTREMNSFLENAEKLGVEKIVFLGDVDQIQSLGAGAAFKLMQKHGMETAIVDRIWRQKNENIRNAVREGIAKDITKSFENLGNYVSNHKDPAKTVAKEYVERIKRGASAEIITPENKTITQITKEVRALLKAEGILENNDTSIKTTKSIHLSNTDKKVLSNYKEGDILAFHKTLANERFKAGETYSVINTEKETNIITLLNTKTSRTKTWLLDESVKHFPYDVKKNETKDFSKGDKIRFTENHRDAGIERHETGIISRLNKSIVTVKTDSEKTHTFRIDSAEAKSLTHNYATTVFANQGKSIDTTLVAMMGKAFSTTYENFYVAISRAVDHLHVFTDDKAALEKTIQRSADQQTMHATEHEDISTPDRSSENEAERDKQSNQNLQDRSEDQQSKEAENTSDENKSEQNIEDSKSNTETEKSKDTGKSRQTDNNKTQVRDEQRPVTAEQVNAPEDRSRQDRSR